MPASSSSSFVDPSSISLPSPSPEPTSAPATTSTANLQSTSTSSTSDQPSRKRPRIEVSSEERKEARAHRNRIAAQNSRDRRKAQFQYLEQRVADLEEENRLLRASIGLVSISTSAPSTAQPKQPSAEELREKENQELKERIRTLERGWDAVVKALAAQGLPTGIPLSGSDASTSTPDVQTTSLPTPVSLTPASSSADKSTSPASSSGTTADSPASPTKLKQETLTFPTLTPAPIGFPLSPAPSASSLDSFDIDMELDLSSSASASSLFASSDFKVPTIVPEQAKQPSHEQDLSTRHLARVATTAFEAVSLQRTYNPTLAPPEPEVDDATMETLFREILAASPSLPTKSLPDSTESGALSGLPASAAQITVPEFFAGAGAGVSQGLVGSSLSGMNESNGLLNVTDVDIGTTDVMAVALYDWAADAEMKKLLDMLPTVDGVEESSWDPSMLSAVSAIGV